MLPQPSSHLLHSYGTPKNVNGYRKSSTNHSYVIILPEDMWEKSFEELDLVCQVRNSSESILQPSIFSFCDPQQVNRLTFMDLPSRNQHSNGKSPILFDDFPSQENLHLHLGLDFCRRNCTPEMYPAIILISPQEPPNCKLVNNPKYHIYISTINPS
jgi:hypothetical protein